MTSIIETKLFNGLNLEQAGRIIARLGGKDIALKKGEYLARSGDVPKYLYLLSAGRLSVIHIDYLGRRTIMNTISEGGLFGGGFALSKSEKIPFDVVADIETRVIRLSADKIIEQDSIGVEEVVFLKNLIKILATRSVILMEKIKNLSQRSLRHKIASFLSAYAVNSKAVVPFDRQEMADYLCVDRASLSRELSNMKKEGLLDYFGKTFYLKKGVSYYE